MAGPSLNPGTRERITMMHQELRQRFPGYWWTGTGTFALVCGSSRRITFCQTLEIGQALKHANCGGRGCDRYAQPHLGYRMDAPVIASNRTGLSPGFRKWVAS